MLCDLIEKLNAVLVNCKDLNILGPDVTIIWLLVHDFVKRGQQPKLLLDLCIKNIDLILRVDDILYDFVGLAEARRQVSFVKRNGSLYDPHSFSELDDLQVIGVGEEDDLVILAELNALDFPRATSVVLDACLPYSQCE